ncbi:MAG: hypothetical protein JNL38_24950 [Myxococcales bacterium]|nr:hypothetical protein [Myxococcales bacterium]
MNTRSLVVALASLSTLALGGCAAAPRVQLAVAAPAEPPAAAAPAMVPEPEPAPEPRSVDAIAETCARGPRSKVCGLSLEAVREICKSGSPSRAARAFGGAPKLTRAYLRGDAVVWSSIRGARTTKGTALLDEEVLVLSEASARGSVIVSGSAVSYEVLRWNGSCATLSDGELTLRAPAKPRRPVDFDVLDAPTRDWLSGERVGEAEAARAAACAREPFSARCTAAIERRDDAIGRAFRAAAKKQPAR